jgi:predicted O-methyltransferase YrrM
MISDELFDYAEQHSTPESPLLEQLNRETNLTQIYPHMLAGHMQGLLLKFISQMIKPLRILEIGTFTGYSAINLALGLQSTPQEEGILHTIEVDPEQEDGIRNYLKETGLEKKVILHIGEAMKIIPTLDEVWDLVYIDADKSNYLNYYKLVFDRVRPGGFILADNALWDGKVLDPTTRSRDTHGIIDFNEFVMKDDRVENLLVPFRDGVMVVRKTPTDPTSGPSPKREGRSEG